MKNYRSAIWLGVIWGITATLAPLPSAAQDVKSPSVSTAAASATLSVDRVEVSRAGQRTEVRIEGASSLAYHVLRLANPNRLVMDFDGALLGPGRNTATSSNDPVTGIRLGQFNSQQVRLVVDLTHPSGYAVGKDGQDLVVTFADAVSPDARGNKAAGNSGQPSGSAAKSSDGAQHAPLAEFKIPLSEFNQTPLAALDPDLAAPPTAAPAPAQPQPPAARAAAAAAQVQAGPQDSLAQAATAASAAQSQTTAEDQTPHYSGEPVSVNLKDVDLKDFFRLIHEISGLNVVLDPSVHGTVTLVLDDVPWDQALDIVLRNNGLAKQLDGNVLRIASQDTLRREAEQRIALKKAESDAVEPVTVTRVLSYAKASELVVPLRRFLSSRGDIISQDRANMLIIKDIPSTMPQMDSLIRQLDRKTAQVEIQARVVQASRSFARDIGTQLAASGVSGGTVLGGAGVVGTSPLVHSGTVPLSIPGTPTDMPLVTNFGANAPTSGISLGFQAGSFALDYIISAAESKGVGKLLSSPQLVTQNNALAVVKQGTEVPIQTTINNTISVQYVDAVLKLQVTPQITVDGTVLMDVTVENTQIDNGIPLVQGIPALDTESTQTKVIVADGGTVVIGGVMVNQQQTNVYEVPLLGSIPLIGHLFKRNTVSVESQELLFFLTPRILPS